MTTYLFKATLPNGKLYPVRVTDYIFEALLMEGETHNYLRIAKAFVMSSRQGTIIQERFDKVRPIDVSVGPYMLDIEIEFLLEDPLVDLLAKQIVFQLKVKQHTLRIARVPTI